MNDKNYTPSTPTRQAEAVTRANIIRADISPSSAKGFRPDHGEFRPGGPPADYLAYFCLGYEVRLRFSLVWTAVCPALGIETQFTNRKDDDKIIFLSAWLTAHIERPQAPQAQLRHTTPAVLYLAQQHNISPTLAQEIYEERAF